MAIFRKHPIEKPETPKCICENMHEDGMDMTTIPRRSVDYNGMSLYENYGWWWLQFDRGDRVEGKCRSIEIFYCPLCGRRLNNWEWANDRRIENLNKYAKENDPEQVSL